MSTPAPVLRLLGRAAEPGLESSLTAVRLGLQSVDVVMPVLAGWPLIILSADPRTPQPLVVRAGDGGPLIAAFTAPDRTGGVDGRGRWQTWIRAGVLASGAKHDVGLVINPGSEPTLTLVGQQLAGVAAATPPVTTAPSQHPPGSRALTTLEQTIMAFRAGSTPRESVFDALAAAELLVFSATDPARSFSPAAVQEAVAVFTDESMVSAELTESWRVRVRGSGMAALVGERFDRIVIDPNTAYQLLVPLEVIPH